MLFRPRPWTPCASLRILLAMPEPWKPSTDPLGEALHFLRMSGSFYCLSEFSAPWALDLPPMQDCVMFHVVTAGECRLEVAGAETCLLRPGALALVPHGRGHILSSAPDVKAGKLFDLPRELISDRYEHLRHGGGGTPTTMLRSGEVRRSVCAPSSTTAAAADRSRRVELARARMAAEHAAIPHRRSARVAGRRRNCDHAARRHPRDSSHSRVDRDRSASSDRLAPCTARPADRPCDRADPSRSSA